MFKKARFVLNLLQNYKKIGENLQLFREILYFCIKISNIFASRLLYNQKSALSGVFFLMVYDNLEREKWGKIGGKQEIKSHLENLGFVVGGAVTIVNTIGGNVIVNVKESRIAISKEMAQKIMI